METKSRQFNIHRWRTALAGATWLTLAFLLAPPGCGSNATATNEGSANNPKSNSESKSRTPDSAKSGAAGVQKMLDGIPYDVFFDKPLIIAANTQTPAASNSNSAAPAENSVASTGTTTNTAGNTATAEPAKGSGGGQSLKDLIDKDSLANEIKAVRNYLAGKTSAVGTYNSSYLEIPPEAATLAVLAVAVAKYPEDFSWKKNAKFVRELAAKIAEITASKDAKTKNSFDAVSDAFTKIDDILKGSEPAGLPAADDEKDFGEAVGSNVVLLMKRIKKSEETLKASVNSEATLKKEAEKVAQEGAVLAFMGGVITTDGFGWGGDADFAKYAQPLVNGGKLLIEASKSGNFSQYGDAMGKVAKSCNDCHPKFKP